MNLILFYYQHLYNFLRVGFKKSSIQSIAKLFIYFTTGVDRTEDLLNMTEK